MLRLIVLGCFLLSSFVSASVVIGESLEQMTRGSNRIVRGFVANTEARIDARTGNIFTYVDFEVVEALKGARSKVLRLKISGGTVGNVGQEVVGSARFEVGQETVLFLEPSDETDVFLVRAMAAGKVDLHRSGSGEVRAKRQLDGLSFVLRDPSAAARGEKPNADMGSADVFLAKVRSLVGAL